MSIKLPNSQQKHFLCDIYNVNKSFMLLWEQLKAPYSSIIDIFIQESFSTYMEEAIYSQLYIVKNRAIGYLLSTGISQKSLHGYLQSFFLHMCSRRRGTRK